MNARMLTCEPERIGHSISKPLKRLENVTPTQSSNSWNVDYFC